MRWLDISKLIGQSKQQLGLAHFAISVEPKEKVNLLAEQGGDIGYKVIRGARTTGNGNYESVISDPEGNLIEITT